MKSKLYFLTFFWKVLFSSVHASEPISTEERPTTPSEVYGPEDAETVLILGNGGAGPTCILQALCEDFISSQHLNIRIGWIQTISRLTLENLKDGFIDISLTYESDPELQAIEEGWATERTSVFNDHFILVGPKNNPAGISSTDTLEEAFRKIANSGSFFSRNDFSGSNQKERMIWKDTGILPWEGENSWYITEKVFPADALLKSDKEGLYTITDRGTLLSTHSKLTGLAVYKQDSENLMNRCHAMLQENPSPLARQFLEYLVSERAQELISVYAGKEAFNEGCPLFTPAAYDVFLEGDCLEKLGFAPE